MPANSRAHKEEKRKPGKSKGKRKEPAGTGKPGGSKLPERQRKHHGGGRP